jgi:hypothetical protein
MKTLLGSIAVNWNGNACNVLTDEQMNLYKKSKSEG